MEETKVVQEAEVLSEKVIEKPIIAEPEARIEKAGIVTNNIKEVKENMLLLKNYYSKYVVTEESRNDAKDEKAAINKTITRIADFRKNIVNEFKEPINEFEEEAKTCEKIGKEIYDLINSQINALDETKKIEAKEELKRYFNEYKESQNLGFTQYEDMNQSVGLSDISDKGVVSKKKYTEVKDFIDNIIKDVNTIETMENSSEILAEYMKDRDLSRSIKDVQDRNKTIENINETSMLSVSKPQIIEPVETEILKAPTTIQKVEPKKLKRARFEIIYEDENFIKELVELFNERGIKYATIK